MVYSKDDRVEIIMLYGEERIGAHRAATRFNNLHPDKNVSARYVLDLFNKFRETGSVGNKKRTGGPPNEVETLTVVGETSLNQQTSIRNLSTLTGLQSTKVWRILKNLKYRPYKFSCHQELSEDDFDRRTEFCEVMSNTLSNTPNQLQNICFSNEATFNLRGEVNKHNYRYWSTENPHWMREEHCQYPEKLNAWLDIYGDHIIGPIFIDGNLTGEKYLDMLQNIIEPTITHVLENDDMLDENLIIFQQDGAPPHYTLPVRQYLNRTFPSWIGRRGTIEWPARSPDLTPLDFFVWGYLKNKIFQNQSDSLADLHQRITNECGNITPVMLQNVRAKFEDRL